MEFLNPAEPLLHEVVGWLCANRVVEAVGAHSLAYVAVVVPTAQ